MSCRKVASAIVDITVATADAGTLALVAAGALGGAVGNVASPGINNLDCTQKGFNFKQLGVFAAIGGVFGFAGAKVGTLLTETAVRIDAASGVSSTGGPSVIVGEAQAITEAQFLAQVSESRKIPVVKSGHHLNVSPSNELTTINGIRFTGHALDQMQSRGILSPTAVVDVIQNPAIRTGGNTPGELVFIRDGL